jgi:hypothetical protein
MLIVHEPLICLWVSSSLYLWTIEQFIEKNALWLQLVTMVTDDHDPQTAFFLVTYAVDMDSNFTKLVWNRFFFKEKKWSQGFKEISPLFQLFIDTKNHHKVAQYKGWKKM